MKTICLSLLIAAVCLATSQLCAQPLVYEGEEGVGKSKHIVFIANDHEYRSEEACPLLAKLMAKHLGFKCTVLFGIDEQGYIMPGAKDIPHLAVLKSADLLVFFTRFMSLPDEQVQHLVDYLERGGPVVGMRTSTHCFNKQGGNWSKFNFNYKGEDYDGGFGKQVFGNTWEKAKGQSHYGGNHNQGGTYTAVATAKDHPIMIGVAPLHAYSGAYKSQPPADATPLIEAQVLSTFGPSTHHADKVKVNAGWARDHYTAPSGDKKQARVVYTSIGASEDFIDPNSRRLLINSCLWSLGMEEAISADIPVDIPGGFEPSAYSNGSFYRTGVKPADLAGFDSVLMPRQAGYAGIPGNAKRTARVLRVRPELLKRVQEAYPDLK